MCEWHATTPSYGRPQRHPSWCEEMDLGEIAALLQDPESEVSRGLAEWLKWREREHPDFPRQWLDE